MNNIFFFQTKQIPLPNKSSHDASLPENSTIFDQFKQQNIFYSYFLVNQNYYIFFYAQQPIQLDFIYQSIDVIQELDSKQRKLRSLRGFFLYALEIIQNADNYESLKTNLQPFFWKKVRNIIRQNKKAALQEFLFGSEVTRSGNEGTRMGEEADNNFDNKGSNLRIQLLETQIQTLQNQVDSLEQKISELENFKKVISELLKRSQASKIDQQYNYTLEGEKAPYLRENDSEIKDSTSQGKDIESKSLLKHGVNFDSDASKSDFKTPSRSQ